LTAQAGEQPLAGLCAVVTGASSGIGRAIAAAFAGAGAQVGAGHWRSEPPDLGVPLRADLATADGCAAFVDAAFAALGEIHVWVNNAGADVLTGEAASWPDERKLDALIDLDLKGTIRCSRLVAPRLADGGCILNMGWDQATTGMAGDSPELFSAIKAGVLGFSKSFARSVAPRVRVNVLCPGWIETAFGAGADPEFRASVAESTPLGRWGTPDDVARAAVWLASPDAAFITGQAINVNGGVVG
jgi:3-oxoacyl-[acyl-carrier protein] reductase